MFCCLGVFRILLSRLNAKQILKLRLIRIPFIIIALATNRVKEETFLLYALRFGDSLFYASKRTHTEKTRNQSNLPIKERERDGESQWSMDKGFQTISLVLFSRSSEFIYTYYSQNHFIFI